MNFDFNTKKIDLHSTEYHTEIQSQSKTCNAK